MSLLYKFKLMIRFLFDKNIPLKEKLWIIIPALYILSPIDLIPFPIFGFSLIDDLIVLAFTLHMVKEKALKYYACDSEEKEKKKQDLHEKNIVEGVEYKVEGEED